jgi:hypothetical protein
LKIEPPYVIGGGSSKVSNSTHALCSARIGHFKLEIFFTSSQKYAHLKTSFNKNQQCKKTKL